MACSHVIEHHKNHKFLEAHVIYSQISPQVESKKTDTATCLPKRHDSEVKPAHFLNLGTRSECTTSHYNRTQVCPLDRKLAPVLGVFMKKKGPLAQRLRLTLSNGPKSLEGTPFFSPENRNRSDTFRSFVFLQNRFERGDRNGSRSYLLGHSFLVIQAWKV
jgi:hypothetical protein